jgi:type I restriction enzyme M protein
VWRSIEIRNFRSLEHVKATLAPFTVVVGPNSSGKSNFVDAFVFARDIATDASHALQNRGGIASIRRWSPARSLDVAIDIRVARTSGDLEHTYAHRTFKILNNKKGLWILEHNFDELVVKGTVRWALGDKNRRLERQIGDVYGVPATAGMTRIIKELQRSPTATALTTVRRLRLEPEKMRPPQEVTERTDLDESGSNIAAAVQSLRSQPGAWANVMAAMMKIIPGLSRIEEVISGRYVGFRWFQRRPGDKEAEFTSTEMSEGALRALAILVAAQQLRPHELLILEEPEVALHPGATGVLFDALKAASRRGSVLITTHSPDRLDAARDEEILVCDYRKGVTDVGPLDQRQRKLVRDGLFSISEIMRAEPLRIDGKRPPLVED